MVPHSIQDKLQGLRRRERLLTLIWGASCLLALVLVLVLLGGLIDWLIDRQRDTPWSVRLGLFVVQVTIASVAALVFLVWPQLKRLPDATLALWVEDKLPRFAHRLISAVQLNQPGARLEGMSVELVGVVTKQAEQEARQTSFARVADHARLKWSCSVLLPVLLLVAIPMLLWPNVCWALLSRQALMETDIPHSVYLTSISPEFWPIGDKIPIQYRVSGEYDEDSSGTLWVTPDGQPTDRYDLEFIEHRTDPSTGEKYGVFGAVVYPSSVDVTYGARLTDGRTRLPSQVRLVPRPVVADNQAWMQYPAFCGKRPSGEPYEQPQGRGDVTGIPGSSVRVQFTVQKPIPPKGISAGIEPGAWIELLGPDKAALEKVRAKKSEDDAPLPEVVHGKIKMTLASDGTTAEATFPLADGLTGYRMVVVDEYGFANMPQPRRSLRLVPEDPPQVALLRDTFGRAGLELEGLPVVLGKQIRVPYYCMDPYGLGKKVNILYRVLKKHESGEEPAEEAPWVRLPLSEVVIPVNEIEAARKSVQDIAEDQEALWSRLRTVAVRSDPKQETKEPVNPATLLEISKLQSALLRKSEKERKRPNPLPETFAAALKQMNLAVDDLDNQEAVAALDRQEEVLKALKKTLNTLEERLRPEFDSKWGVFQHMSWDEQLFYYRVPSKDPDKELGFTQGGGRYFLETRGLINSKGMPLKLKSGDQIEYCVEVFGADRATGPVPSTISETRVSTVMDLSEFLAWQQQVSDEASRISELEKRQRGVVDPK